MYVIPFRGPSVLVFLGRSMTFRGRFARPKLRKISPLLQDTSPMPILSHWIDLCGDRLALYRVLFLITKSLGDAVILQPQLLSPA